ncbi:MULTISPECIES: DUF934 domain-containing protein [unclassified Janthinobacterium]|uniref:DUF934 domain-containing protein n=1 Tax=unclassified Janthinobacterium TaxID=2610881 RepID=UPI0016224C80|nr:MULTISPECIES: DUF934 domain-containing protein [unclassified Janthinobacterium]MBB5369781.1 uncharacterized protein (DUF934 family) [Janthinobacterium sp. K2C7]MBB5382263.1 uncharacterized protein (DUF934 family) [Janthinobacterium sp. K2Li3]MBB5387840.1 uncharacterized protein (DUF934 family) [Janthinobacterium sp. K2E3]
MFEVREEIIKNAAVVANDWGLLRLDEGDTPETVVVPAGKAIVPLSVWKAQHAALATRLPEIGVWLASDERPEELAADIQQLTVIGIDFPKFTDGRGYSIAFNLRARLAYTGELRAIGDVLRDQLFSMHRVGFDAYATRPDRSIHDALKGLSVFSETYQASWDQKSPLFRRHHREGQNPDLDNAAGI